MELQQVAGSCGRTHDVRRSLTLSPPARILVCDDQRVHRGKLALAVRALGHSVETVTSGSAAVARLAETRFDVVLLDILMPDMDGYDVMRFMQRDRRMSDIPVIVVSALDRDVTAVVRAIELGAEDFLPKRFDAVLLAARLDSTLARRRASLREREHREHLARLLEAALLLERRDVAAARLALDETCQRDDALGRLARVFVTMASEVHARRARLQARLDRLRLAALVIVTGTVLGLVLPFAYLASLSRPDVAGLALWLTGAVALLCLAGLPFRVPASRSCRELLRPAAALAALGGAGVLLPLLWLVQQLPPGSIAILLPAEFLVALIAGMALHGRTVDRFAFGALLLTGIALVLAFSPRVVSSLGWTPLTSSVALLVPVSGVLVSRRVFSASASSVDGVDVPRSVSRDVDVATAGSDTLKLIGLAAALCCLASLPIVAMGDGWFLPFGDAPDAVDSVPVAGLTLALLAIVLAAGACLRALLVRVAGAARGPVIVAVSSVFAALATLGWSVLLLGHSVLPWAVVSAGLATAAAVLRGATFVPVRRAQAEPPDVELA